MGNEDQLVLVDPAIDSWQGRLRILVGRPVRQAPLGVPLGIIHLISTDL